ncbi:MAG TPA: ribonuclease domain-containing protein [Microlunatus sp.]
MNRTVGAVGGVVTAVAIVVVLAFAYLQQGGPSPTVTSESAPSASASGTGWSTPRPSSSDGLPVVRLADLPVQARQTVALIDAGGPFPYAKDGATFNNFEGVLPSRPRGFYREYTVKTPGERDRGARRIVTGDRDRELFYTADHYDTFVRVQR